MRARMSAKFRYLHVIEDLTSPLILTGLQPGDDRKIECGKPFQRFSNLNTESFRVFSAP